MLALAWLWVGLPAEALYSQATPVPVYTVAREQVVAAMRAERGYDISKTTNAGRFQGSVYLRLVRGARSEDTDSGVLRIAHDDWFEAFVQATGVAREDVPVHIQRAYASRQSAYLDARPGAVVAEVRQGPRPLLAVNVRLSWPPGPGVPASYSFEDRFSEPEVLVHNDRVVTFRLLDFGGWTMFDEVSGSRIRPTTGALGVLFRLIGLASVSEVRMSTAADGTALARATARKLLIRVRETVTIMPDGRADRGLPDDRPDLRALEQRLRRELEIDYVPLAWERLLTS